MSQAADCKTRLEGPYSAPDAAMALRMRSQGFSLTEIGAAVYRSEKSLRQFFISRDCHQEELRLREEQKEKLAPREIPPEVAADLGVIKPLWELGLAPFAVLERVNRSRIAAVRPKMEMGDLHRFVVTHKIIRHEAPKPKLLEPRA